MASCGELVCPWLLNGRDMTRTAWRASLEAHSLVLRVFESEMQEGVGFSLAWYDILLHLSEAPGRSMRMNELAESLVLSRSWLSRRVEAMEAAGLVQRWRAEEDARGVCAALTPEGQRAYRRAAKVHVEAVQEHFMAYLSVDEASTISACFDRVGEAARLRLSGGG
jgi:DNA-binding MarR family transcriptional regulator